MLAFTRTGEHGLLWFAVAGMGALADPPRRPLYLSCARTVAIAYAANIVLKHAIRRRRPLLDGFPALSATLTGLAFPSAHSTTSFAAARVLSRELPAAPPYACAAAMALSRPYVGVHFPSDVLAGALLGTAIAEIVR